MRSTFTIAQQQVKLSATLPVRAEPLRVEHDVPPHDHDYHEICVVWSGACEHARPDGRETLGRGSLIVVPPGGVHAFHRPRALEVTNLYYLTEWLLSDLRALWDTEGLVPLFVGRRLFGNLADSRARVIQLAEPELAAVRVELEALEAERQVPHPSPLLLRASLLKCLVILSRAFARTSAGDLAPRCRPEVWAALDHVEDVLAQGGDGFRPAALARRAGVSPDHLGRLFRETLGCSLTEYFQRRRVEQAKLLLLDRRRTVTDVAHELGFTDGAHLCRHFQRHVGESPRAYRRRYC